MNDFSEIDEVRKLFAAIVREKLPGIELKSLRVSYDEDLYLLLAKKYGSAYEKYTQTCVEWRRCASHSVGSNSSSSSRHEFV